MLELTIAPTIKALIPDFKIGLITYHHIAISDSPQMLKGRLQFFSGNAINRLGGKRNRRLHRY